MKVLVNGKVIGEIITNRSLTIEDVMYYLGYDITNVLQPYILNLTNYLESQYIL